MGDHDYLAGYAERLMLTKAQTRARLALLAGAAIIAAGSAFLFGELIRGPNPGGTILFAMVAAMLGTIWVCATTKDATRAPILPPLRSATRSAARCAMLAYIGGALTGGLGLAIMGATTGVLFGFWYSLADQREA